MPRVISAGSSSAAASEPWSDSRSPYRSTSRRLTDSPRVFLGSRAPLTPSASVTRLLRASILAGEGSNALAAGDVLATLVAAKQGGQVGRRGNLGFLDFSEGMNIPSVRFSRRRYCLATSCTCWGVTFSSRSRCSRYSRQSPWAAQSLSSTAMRPVSAARQLALLEQLLLGPFDFGLGERRCRRHSSTTSSIVSLASSSESSFAHFGVDFEHARVVPTGGAGRDVGGLLGFDQGLVQAARGRGAEDVAQHVERGDVLVPARGNVIARRHEAHVAHAAQRSRCARRPAAALRCRSCRACASGLGSEPKCFSTSCMALASSNLPAITSMQLSGW